MIKKLSVLILPLLVFDSSSLFAGKRRHHLAHVHGQAQMSVAVDGSEMEVLFQTPADGVLGFEHQPSNEKEKKILEDAKEKLKGAALAMISFSKAMKCSSTLDNLDITLAQLRRSKMDERLGLPASAKGHGDIKAVYKITCPEPIKGMSLSFDVHKYFERIKKTKVVVLTDTKQWSKDVELKPVSVEI